MCVWASNGLIIRDISNRFERILSIIMTEVVDGR
jgi:hypothetical protein